MTGLPTKEICVSILPHYIHIIKPKLKHIYLSFNEEGNLVIKSPKVSQIHIEKILLKKASWIQKSRKKFETKKGKILDFTQDSEIYFLGEAHPLTLTQTTKKYTKLTFDGDVFNLHYHIWDPTIFIRHIDAFYKKEIEQYLPLLVEKWAKTMQVTPGKTRFRKTKRQWGSCSANNDLSFNTQLMKLPLSTIEYVVVHELTHITHKHHQKSFWEHLARYLPDYTLQINTLKTYTT